MLDLDRTPGIRPRQDLRRRVDAAARASVPVLTTFLLMVLTSAPFGVPQEAVLLPATTVVSVFFWSVYRPASIPPQAVLFLGLTVDLLGWLPLGVGGVTLLLVHALAVRWRRALARQGFGAIWAISAGVSTFAAVVIWGMASALSLHMLPIGTALFQALIGVTLYPVLAIPFTRAHRGIAAPELA